MLMLSPFFWLALVFAGAVGYLKGCTDEQNSHAKDQAKAVQAARETESEIRRLENRSTSAYLARVLKQQEKANALPKVVLPADCAVPADAGRVLNDAQQYVPDDAGARSSAGAASQAVDSTCAAELDIAKRNYAEICLPNAAQLTELQKRWEEVRQLLNHQGSSQ